MTIKRIKPEGDFSLHAVPAVEEAGERVSAPPEEVSPEEADTYVAGYPERVPTLQTPPLAVDLHRDPDNSLICNSCWRENVIADSDHHFCIHCGSSLRLGHALASLPVSKKEEVAILFVKVSGYQHSDPETAAGYLEDFRRIVGNSVGAMGGFVKFMGDKAILAFGALDNVRGNRARSNSMRALQTWQMIVSELSKPLLVSGGAHLGKIVAGTLGITGEKNYDLLGTDVNFASRLLGPATAGQGLVLSLPFQKVLLEHGFYGADFEAEVTLKGFEGQHEIFRLSPSSTTDIPYPGTTDPTQTIELPTCTRHQESTAPYCPHCGNASGATEDDRSNSAENRNVIVLSVDMVGFSTLSNSLSPSKIFEWVDNFYAVAEPIFTRHHGTIIERNGDELVVRFGVPSVGNNAINAVLAGINLREALADWNHRHQGPPIRVRMGIHSEKALVKGRTTLGSVVEKAQARQSLASAGGFLVDSKTAKLVEDCFVMNQTETGYEIVEAIPQAIDLVRRRSQAIPPVGREREIQTIREAFQEAKKGHLQMRLLVGNPGSGRQSALNHFYLEHSAELTILSGQITDWQADPLRLVLRKMVEDEEKLNQWIRRVNVHRWGVKEIPYGFTDLSDLLKSVLGRYVGLEMKESEGMKFLRQNPAQLRAWTVRGVGLFLRALAQKKTLVLDLRDLDRADPESLDFLRDVIGQNQNCPIYILATASQGMREEDAEYKEIIFKNLDRENAQKLVLAILVKEDLASEQIEEGEIPAELHHIISADVFDLLYSQSAGNPLYLAELTRAAYQKGVVFWNRISSQWELKPLSHGEKNQIPATLDEALLSRLDDLNSAEKNLFQAVACLADREGVFWLEPLLHFMQSSADNQIAYHESEIHALLARLEQKGIVAYQAGSSHHNGTEYRITPPLLASAQYQIIPPGIRKRIHSIYYEWFSEQATSERSPSPALVGIAARHARGAERYREAYEHYLRAMSMAGGSLADQKTEAIRYSELAEESLHRSNLENPHEPLFDLLNLRAEIYSKRIVREGWERTLVQMEKLLELDPSLDETRQLLAHLARGDYEVKVNNDPQFYGQHDQKWHRRLDQVPPELAARYYFNIGRSYSIDSHHQQAIQAYNQAATYASRGVDRKIEAKILMGLSSTFLRYGSYQSSLDYAKQALPLLEEAGDYHHACYCLINMYEDLFQLKRLEEAAEMITRANDLALRLGDQEAIGYSYLNWGILLAYQQPERSLALQKIQEAVKVSRDSGLTHMLAVSLYTRGFLMSMDRPEQTDSDAHEALGCPGISPSVRASALFVMAVGHWRGGRKRETHDALVEALQLRRQLQGPINDFDTELKQFALSQAPELERDDPTFRHLISDISPDILSSPSPLLPFPSRQAEEYSLDEAVEEKKPEESNPAGRPSFVSGERLKLAGRRTAKGFRPVEILKK